MGQQKFISHAKSATWEHIFDNKHLTLLHISYINRKLLVISKANHLLVHLENMLSPTLLLLLKSVCKQVSSGIQLKECWRYDVLLCEWSIIICCAKCRCLLSVHQNLYIFIGLIPGKKCISSCSAVPHCSCCIPPSHWCSHDENSVFTAWYKLITINRRFIYSFAWNFDWPDKFGLHLI